jgi:hypothetical protein
MNRTIKQTLGKMYIALSMASVVMILIVAKYYIGMAGFDFITLNTLTGNIIGSSIFVIGFLLSSVFADYKEIEKIPAEICSLLISIVTECESLSRKQPDFDSQRIRDIVSRFISEFEHGLSDTNNHSHIATSLLVITEMDSVFDEMEQRGVPPNYISRIKSEQAILRKFLFRVSYIQSTKFVPSISVLVDTIVAIVVLLIMFTKIDIYSGMIMFGLISYILLYIMQVIHMLEKPFRKGKDDTCDDVSIFLLRDLRDNLKEGRVTHICNH